MLDQLHLKNFRNHRDLTVNFTKGVNGIVGKNGRGKSVIIEAIKFLFIGKLDNTKEEVITLGEASGYVSGRLTIDGKTATLKRHLGESKVSLEYDGKKYIKAGEVKDLWASLFQIDATIFTNVIIAAQGEIPLLFTGDQADRERIFQKLFMVPPTDKIRLSIWNDYIKTAPPEFPVETQDTLAGLKTDISGFQKEIALATAQIKEIDDQLLSQAQHQEACARVSFLKDCIAAKGKMAPLAAQVEKEKAEVVRLTGLKADLLAKINAVDYTALVQRTEALQTIGRNQAKRTSLLAELGALTSKEASDASARKNAKAEIAALNDTLMELSSVDATLRSEINQADARISKLSKVSGSAECPTCLQPVKDVEKVLAELKAINAEKDAKVGEAGKLILTIRADKARLEASISLFEKTQKEADRINSLLEAYPEAAYDAKEYAQLQKDIQQYSLNTSALKGFDSDLAIAQDALKAARDALSGLAKYDGESTPEKELDGFNLLLSEYDSQVKSRENLRLLVREKEVQIEGVQTRIQNSERYAGMNQKRNEYLGCLQKVYDLFHTSQFPRRLIASYASEVEAGLSRNLSQFNLPFFVKVDEAFKINVLDEEGRLLPKVSGGQAVVMGLCLRLALHALFSQSFPMLIIDEGTTHLDEEENKPLYFEMIRNIGKEANIQQIIIIDHDERLLDVVDNMIKL